MQSQKCAVKAFGPFSKVPADKLSKQKLATMALVPVRQVPPAQQSSCVPEQTNTVAFMSAVVASTSEAAANKVVRKGNGFQVEQSLVSKKFPILVELFPRRRIEADDPFLGLRLLSVRIVMTLPLLKSRNYFRVTI